MKKHRTSWIPGAVAIVIVSAVCIYSAMGISPSYKIVAVGDVASKNGQQSKTAQLVKMLNPDKILLLGNIAYEKGALDEFNRYFDPAWKDLKTKILPAPGNREYDTSGVAGYYEYFGTAAGPRHTGYYSFDIGSWHVVSLNSEIVNQTQTDWLKNDLYVNKQECILAYWHRPLFSSGKYGDSKQVKVFWDILYQSGADIVLNSHDTVYERFAKQNSKGQLDPKGIRQFTVGTGGASATEFKKIKANSEAHFTGIYGVLQLTLKKGSYDASFLPAEGSTSTDSVKGVKCNS